MFKKIILFTAILFVAFSCSKEQGIILPLQKGNVSFSFTNSDLVEAKAISSVDVNPTAIFISIVDSENETVINNQRFELLTFGSSFITDAIELSEGSYEITTFNVVDEDNTVIYASPLTGSENAEFVNNPLPIAFNVTGNESDTVSPEVIFVGPETTPEQFGFTSFSFTIIEIPTDPETQDLYLTITDPNNSAADGDVLIEIPTQNFSLNTRIFVDHIPITIPATEVDEEIIITVMYEGHDDQTLTLNTDQILDFNEQNPFEIIFETVTIPTPENLILFFNLFQVDDGQSFLTDGAYTYTTATNNFSGEGIIGFAEETLELPFSDVEEIYTIKFFHSSYAGSQTIVLTHDEVFATGNGGDSLAIFFDGQPIGTSDNVRRLYIQVYQDDSVDGISNQPLPSFYTADIGNLGFQQEGYLPSSTFPSFIELPDEDHNELTLFFSYKGLNSSASFNSIDAEMYNNADNPLIINLKEY